MLGLTQTSRLHSSAHATLVLLPSRWFVSHRRHRLAQTFALASLVLLPSRFFCLTQTSQTYTDFCTRCACAGHPDGNSKHYTLHSKQEFSPTDGHGFSQIFALASLVLAPIAVFLSHADFTDLHRLLHTLCLCWPSGW